MIFFGGANFFFFLSRLITREFQQTEIDFGIRSCQQGRTGAAAEYDEADGHSQIRPNKTVGASWMKLAPSARGRRAAVGAARSMRTAADQTWLMSKAHPRRRSVVYDSQRPGAMTSAVTSASCSVSHDAPSASTLTSIQRRRPAWRLMNIDLSLDRSQDVGVRGQPGVLWTVIRGGRQRALLCYF